MASPESYASLSKLRRRIITTIAWRGRILAADTQLTWTDHMKSLCRKLIPLSNKGCIAYAGNCDDEVAFHTWWLAGENLDTWDSQRMKKADFDAIYIDQWKDIWYYTDGPEKHKIEHEFHAIGSGAHLAIAGMHMGMTAKESVTFASELDATTNNIIDT